MCVHTCLDGADRIGRVDRKNWIAGDGRQLGGRMGRAGPVGHMLQQHYACIYQNCYLIENDMGWLRRTDCKGREMVSVSDCKKGEIRLLYCTVDCKGHDSMIGSGISYYKGVAEGTACIAMYCCTKKITCYKGKPVLYIQ